MIYMKKVGFWTCPKNIFIIIILSLSLTPQAWFSCSSRIWYARHMSACVESVWQQGTQQTQAEGLQSACLDLAFKLNPEPEISPVLSSFQNINNLTPAQAAACETSPPSSPIPSVVSPFGRTNNAPGLTIVGAPDAMKVFRRNFNWLPLSKKGNYQIFKSGIPMWKLSVDGHGGHWALILRVKANPQQGERSSSPHTGRQAVKTQRASKEKLVQVTPVGMIVVQDDTVYKLPWGCW